MTCSDLGMDGAFIDWYNRNFLRQLRANANVVEQNFGNVEEINMSKF